jgi:hypothetical protein
VRTFSEPLGFLFWIDGAEECVGSSTEGGHRVSNVCAIVAGEHLLNGTETSSSETITPRAAFSLSHHLSPVIHRSPGQNESSI